MRQSKTVKHHLLELILWPNGDGTYRKINHTADELKAMGIYQPNIMTIELTRSEHCILHKPRTGKPFSEDARRRISEGNKGKHADGGKRFKGYHWKLVNGRRTWYV